MRSGRTGARGAPWLLLALLLLAAAATGASAQDLASPSAPTPGGDAPPPGVGPIGAPDVVGSCFAPPAGTAAAAMDAFLRRPVSLLAGEDGAGPALAARVRNLAGSDIRAVDTLVGLARAANAVQRAGIGAGMGRAAFACSKVNAAYAAAIQLKVAELALSDLTLAFTTAANDLQVAFIGARAGRNAMPAGGEVVPAAGGTYEDRRGGVRFSVGSGDSTRRTVNCLSCSIIN